MSTPKELNFFQDPNCLDKLDLYASLFDKRSPVRGESTANYSRHPLIPGVPERISAALPDVKLIYLVREPVGRAVAHYVEAATYGGERRSFEEAFLDVDDPYNPYVATSRYATQIERFLACFSPDDLLVVDHADLRERRPETLREVFGFVGVDDRFATRDFDRILNPTGEKRRLSLIGRRLRQTAAARAVVRLPPRFGEPLLRPVRRLLSDPVEIPSPDARLRERLVHTLEDDVSRFRGLTGKPFAGWSDFDSGATALQDDH
jgi:Sulfotransferase family